MKTKLKRKVPQKRKGRNHGGECLWPHRKLGTLCQHGNHVNSSENLHDYTIELMKCFSSSRTFVKINVLQGGKGRGKIRDSIKQIGVTDLYSIHGISFESEVGSEFFFIFSLFLG